MHYDLFISYSRRDNTDGRVSKLIERIKADFRSFANRSLEAWVDVDQIRVMHDWQRELQQKVRDATLLVTVISPNYLNSKYCESEFNHYLEHEASRGLPDGGVVPIYFVEVPGWNDADYDERAAEWICLLRRRQAIDLRRWNGSGEPLPQHPEVEEGIAELAKRIRPLLEHAAVVNRSLGNIDRHNPHFVGRVEDLSRLHQTLLAGRTGVLAAIHGIGGMGKTALAVEYAHAFAGEYGGGRWQVRCEGRDDLRLALASLAPPLHVEFNEAERLDLNLQFERIIAELRKLADANAPHRCLLVLDNVDQPALLEPAQTKHLPSGYWLHLIVTTQLGKADLHWQQRELAFLPVDELPEAEAVQVIEGYQQNGQFKNNDEREAAVEIVRLLGGLTLAVETAAIFLSKFEDVTCRAFLERLRGEGLEGLEAAAGQANVEVQHGERRLTATLRPMLERLTEAERLALKFAALLPADNIALPWIKTLVAEDYPEIGQEASPGYPDAWQNIVRRLMSLRLLLSAPVQDQSGKLLVARMHRLLQEVMKVESGADKAGLEDELISLAKDRCSFLEEGWLAWANRWEIEPLRALSESLLQRGHKEASWLAISIGRRLLNLARYAEAEPLMRRALAIDEQIYGVEHPRVAIEMSNLAQLLQDTNRLAEAEPLMRRSLAIDAQSYGDEHPHVAVDLNNLASLLQQTNRLTEAEPLMRRALVIDEQSYGDEHPSVAGDLNNLAQLLKATNRLTEAEPLMRRALAIDEHSYGAEHPRMAIELNNLAQLLKATNRLAEAEPLMRRSLAIDEQIYDAEHPNIAIRLNNLAQLLTKTNRLAEAEPLMRRVVMIFEQTYGKAHPNVAAALNNLAQLLQDTNRLAEAEPLMRRSLAIDEQSYGAEHPIVAMRLNNLALLLEVTNRLAEAEPLMRRAVEITVRFKVTTGHEHLGLQKAIGNYVGVLEALGQSEEQIRAQLNEVGRPYDLQLGDE
jgi:tetratricopeptide (TPR) repeat protein